MHLKLPNTENRRKSFLYSKHSIACIFYIPKYRPMQIESPFVNLDGIIK